LAFAGHRPEGPGYKPPVRQSLLVLLALIPAFPGQITLDVTAAEDLVELNWSWRESTVVAGISKGTSPDRLHIRELGWDGPAQPQ
jgi:hypothetical protein